MEDRGEVLFAIYDLHPPITDFKRKAVILEKF